MRCLNTQNSLINQRGQSSIAQTTSKNKVVTNIAEISPDNLKSHQDQAEPIQNSILLNQEDKTSRLEGIHEVKVENISGESIHQPIIQNDQYNDLQPTIHVKLELEMPPLSVLGKRSSFKLELTPDDIYKDTDAISKNSLVETESREIKVKKTLIEKLNEKDDSIDLSDHESSKHRNRITMSQNYKSTLTRGFLRLIKTIRNDINSPYYRFLLKYVEEIRAQSQAIVSTNPQILYDSVMDYIEEKIQGKGSKREKSKTKVGNVKVIHSIFFEKKADNQITAFKKKAAHSLLLFFLKDENFKAWVDTECNSSELNKKFLLDNLDEIRKVFEDPLNYKAYFNPK